MKAMPRLDEADVLAWEASVVTRYLSLFGEAALDMMLTAGGGDVAHLGCRTGYPDALIAERLGQGTLTGVDPSTAALELARTRASKIVSVKLEYRIGDTFPTALPAKSFTHTLSLHPSPRPAKRHALLIEMARLLVPHGQALVALPLRGSFQEIVDLLREHAVKTDSPAMERALEKAVIARPTVESFSEELEEAGFDHVEIELWPTVIDFQSGGDLFDDPIVRLLVIPELLALLPGQDLDARFEYVRAAIDQYWPEGGFELSVNIGCASARLMS